MSAPWTDRGRLKDEVLLEVALTVARLATCRRRAVGCVLVDERGRILATGYNGVAAGMPHCNEVLHVVPHYEDGACREPACHPNACVAAFAPSGTQLDGCEAIHAEQNALLQCRSPDAVATAYVTTPPCVTCVKLLLSTGCRRIVALGDYPQAEAARSLWARAGRAWVAR